MITVENRQPVRARSAWRPADFPSPDAFSFTLTDAHFAAFDAALAANRRAGRNVEDLTARDFALETIADDVAAWRDEVLRGRGFIVLRELPRDRYGCAPTSRWPRRSSDGGRPLTSAVHAYKGTTGILGHGGSSTYYRGNAI